MKFNYHIEQAVSKPRFSVYRAQASSDDHAWALYRWNIDLAAAVVPLTADLEVTLRNTIHVRLTEYFERPDWWDSTSLQLDKNTEEILKNTISKRQKETIADTIEPDKIVSELTLAVWVRLLGSGGRAAYEVKLWRPTLHLGFTTGIFRLSGEERRPTRAAVYERAVSFKELRNRVAHHEPIFNGIQTSQSKTIIALNDVWEQSVELLGWMCPDLANFHRSQNTVPELIRHRPQA